MELIIKVEYKNGNFANLTDKFLNIRYNSLEMQFKIAQIIK